MADIEELSEGDLTPILQKLKHATLADRIGWEEGPDASTFQVVFKGGVVRVRRADSNDFEAEFVAPSGTVIVTYSPEHQPGQTLLKEAFALARASALKPKQVLRDIAREL